MNNRVTRIATLSLFVICLLLTRSTFAFAQTEVATESSQIENSTVSNINTQALPLVFDQERAATRQKYRVAAEAYQQSYRDYSLAKAQFQKLGTLAALEEAVMKTRQALLDRNRLLLIFFELIHLELRASVGVDEERRQDALSKVENFQSELKAQELLIQNSQDRVALVERVKWFLANAEQLRSSGFYVRALLLSGRLYIGYQQALSLYNETKALHQSQQVDSFMTAQRQRAYTEVDAQIELVNAQWTKIQELLFAEGNPPQNRDQNWFQRILPLLSAQQSNLIRLYSFIEELARK